MEITSIAANSKNYQVHTESHFTNPLQRTQINSNFKGNFKIILRMSSDSSKKKNIFSRVTTSILNVFGVDDNEEPTFEISKPFNFKHTTHVQADPHSSTGFSVSDLFAVFVTSKKSSKCDNRTQ